MTGELIRTNAARRAIAAARRVDEVKNIRDKAAAVRLYARQARLGIEMQNDAAEIMLVAERRAGEMLAEMAKSGERFAGGGDRRTASVASTRSLESLGVTRNQSATWQQVAAVPKARFEAYLAACRKFEQEITTAGALRAEFDYKRDKSHSAGDVYVPQHYDACQTPAAALDPLLPYLRIEWTVWEPAAGEGLLVEGLYDAGWRESEVIGSDILTGQNFFDYAPARWDALVTNPPFSIKYKWLERCYALGKPWALLMPVEMLGAKTAQQMFAEHGVEVLFLDGRVNFKMPRAGWTGAGAQFPVAWFTWGMDLGAQMVFAKLKGKA